MFFHRFYTDPLAQAAYLIGHDGQAVVVDPPRDVTELLAFANEKKLKIRHALSTHVHADFVCGVVELAAATGARIGFGEHFDGDLTCDRFASGHTLQIGGATLTVLETPGHTPESVSFLLRAPEGSGMPDRLLSGDTLFLGDVGRPDLVAGRGHSAREMARMLYRSVHQQLAPLPDSTEVWPAHGAGSACGMNIQCAESSTIGQQRLQNWALAETDEQRFCERLLGALRKAPPYFVHVAELNRRGPPLRATRPALSSYTAPEVTSAMAIGVIILDVRSKDRHAAGHYEGALNTGLHGNDFEPWVGALVPTTAELLLHVDEAKQVDVALQRLERIGFDRAVVGFTTKEPELPRRHGSIEAAQLFVDLQQGKPYQVIDVRRADEYVVGHVPGAIHVELGIDFAAPPALQGLRLDGPTAVICRSGYRSSAAMQRLHAAGFRALCNVSDGMLAWTANHLPLEGGGKQGGC